MDDFRRALAYDRSWATGRSPGDAGTPPAPPGPRAVTIRTVERGGSAAVMDRRDVISSFESTVIPAGLSRERVERHYREAPDRYLDGRYQVFLSAGGSGELAFFLYDRRTWCQYLASFLRAFRLAGVALRRSDRIFFVGSSHPAHTLSRVAAAFPARCARVAGMQEGVERAVDAAVRFRPTLLVGYSSALRMLADACAAANRSLRPRCVLAGTDALLAEDRLAMEAAWGLSPRLFYSATEAGMLASECSAGRLHVYQDLVDCEIEDGRLRITHRVNLAQRLVRYRLPGRFAFGEACPCRPGPTLELLDPGRVVRPFAVPAADGSRRSIHPIVLRSALDPFGLGLRSAPRLSGGRLVLELDRAPGSEDAVRRSLLRGLARAGAILDRARLRLVVAPI